MAAGKGKKGKKASGDSKAAAKAAKKNKAAAKQEKREVKQVKKTKAKGKGKDAGGQSQDMDEEDLIRTLEEYRQKWAEDHKVSEETVEGPPSRRANATFTPCPVKDHLYLFGGEYFDGQRVELYADMYRYAPDKNEWRKFTSPTAPGPRSAHQMVASPAAGGKLWLFGGEFSAPNQSSFHHYRDLVFKTPVFAHPTCLIFGFGTLKTTGGTKSSLASWRESQEGVVLHGGYCKIYDGKRSTGIGQALEDTWLLRVPPANEEGVIDFKKMKWEKRKKLGYAPSLRSGCTMALWQAKNMGVLFGGVSDEDKDEETLESVFHNDMFGYNLAGSGRWISLPLKRKKKQGGAGAAKKKKKARALAAAAAAAAEAAKRKSGDVGMSDGEADKDKSDDESGLESDEEEGIKPWELAKLQKEAERMVNSDGSNAGDSSVSGGGDDDEDDDPDDPQKSVPMTRYNAMLAVQRNTLYIYGGILESGDREWTLDDFHTIALDKLDRFNCLRECVIDTAWLGSDSEDDDDDSSDDENDSDDDKSESEGGDQGDEDDDKAPEDDVKMEEEVPIEELKLSDAEQAALEATRKQAEREDLRKRATAFAGVSTSATRSAEDIFSTPQPGETLASFFERSKVYFTQKALEHQPSHKGKELRRDGFELAKEAYDKYLPLLEELIRIQEEAGLDADEAKAGQRAGLGTESRNRR
ncbi:Kelch repeat-containing protein 3 [Microbotryomycetes sp. JL221]|nr:Kelch repeat-containing protein 3 [Microbotryomycetes sp. JL221]